MKGAGCTATRHILSCLQQHGQPFRIVNMNALHISDVIKGAACDLFEGCGPAYLMTQLVGRHGCLAGAEVTGQSTA